MTKEKNPIEDIIPEYIFEKDPEEITEADIDGIIEWFNANRQRFIDAKKTGRGKRKEEKPIDKNIFGDPNATS